VPGLSAGLLLSATLLAPPQDPSGAARRGASLRLPRSGDPPAPGGYWSTSEQRGRRGTPRDGEDELTVGSVLFSLGMLRVGAAALTIWMAQTPGRCPAIDDAGCRSLLIYGWFGVGEGGLMVGTGLTYLIIGGVRRNRYQRWRRGESVALRGREFADRVRFGPSVALAPVVGGSAPAPAIVGGGVRVRVQF
jgi:hypothetical protein